MSIDVEKNNASTKYFTTKTNLDNPTLQTSTSIEIKLAEL